MPLVGEAVMGVLEKQGDMDPAAPGNQAPLTNGHADAQYPEHEQHTLSDNELELQQANSDAATKKYFWGSRKGKMKRTASAAAAKDTLLEPQEPKTAEEAKLIKGHEQVLPKKRGWWRSTKPAKAPEDGPQQPSRSGSSGSSLEGSPRHRSQAANGAAVLRPSGVANGVSAAPTSSGCLPAVLRTAPVLAQVSPSEQYHAADASVETTPNSSHTSRRGTDADEAEQLIKPVKEAEEPAVSKPAKASKWFRGGGHGRSSSHDQINLEQPTVPKSPFENFSGPAFDAPEPTDEQEKPKKRRKPGRSISLNMGMSLLFRTNKEKKPAEANKEEAESSEGDGEHAQPPSPHTPHAENGEPPRPDHPTPHATPARPKTPELGGPSPPAAAPKAHRTPEPPANSALRYMGRCFYPVAADEDGKGGPGEGAEGVVRVPEPAETNLPVANGLYNHGQTCFLNASIQCIFATPGFVAQLLPKWVGNRSPPPLRDSLLTAGVAGVAASAFSASSSVSGGSPAAPAPAAPHPEQLLEGKEALAAEEASSETADEPAVAGESAGGTAAGSDAEAADGGESIVAELPEPSDERTLEEREAVLVRPMEELTLRAEPSAEEATAVAAVPAETFTELTPQQLQGPAEQAAVTAVVASPAEPVPADSVPARAEGPGIADANRSDPAAVEHVTLKSSVAEGAPGKENAAPPSANIDATAAAAGEGKEKEGDKEKEKDAAGGPAEGAAGAKDAPAPSGDSASKLLKAKPPLRERILGPCPEGGYPPLQPGEMAASFRELAAAMFTSQPASAPAPLPALSGQTQSVVEPRRVLAAIGRSKEGEHFLDGNQHDCQEVTRFILDGLHNDLNRATPRVDTAQLPEAGAADAAAGTAGTEGAPAASFEAADQAAAVALLVAAGAKPAEIERLREAQKADKAWQAYLKAGNSIITDLFAGQLQSNVTCKECKSRSTQYEAFLDLSLPLAAIKRSRWNIAGTGEPNALDQLLSSFTGDEELEDYACEKCRKKTGAVKQMRVYRAPRALMIHLKRFRHTLDQRCAGVDKIKREIKFDKALSLQNYMAAEVAAEAAAAGAEKMAPANYELYAVVFHQSESVHQGHYYATCRVPSGSQKDVWYKYDDGSVAKASDKFDLKSAYLLFYVRKQ